ncbi:MAG: hypothetical protein INQ03_09740 [Candidatus Heimdallarchaeota archaeon]|nr:hypothetical protein [Candidatus Heimdallarchaeota archaeon]
MLDNPEVLQNIRVQTLINAKMYDGHANPKAVMGKLLGTYKELRPFAKDLGPIIASMVKEISSMSMEEIDVQISQLAPDAIQQEKQKKETKSKARKEQKKDLPNIPSAVKGKFTVRYAPDPSKYPHIGQGMNFLINRMYADKYEGKVVLRFDDTNPAIVQKKYFDAIKEGLLWLGCTWDKEVRASQFLDEFYDVAKQWIEQQWMYVCLCEGETLSKGREDGKACMHRTHSVKENQQLFAEMLANKYLPGEATVRLMGDMTSDNNVMRDPIMYRIVTETHEMLDQFYPVFPTYDFESSYLDWKMGVTHIIRSGEFGTMRQELQGFIINKLGGTTPEFRSFGRFNIQGCPTKGRVIRELVQSKVVSGWDDIRLITLAGLKHRGIHPHTPRILIQEAGLTPKNTNIAWSTVEKKSKELLEPNSKRLFFVEDPVKLHVSDGPQESVEFPFHPDQEGFGKRILPVGKIFHISKSDADELQVGDIIRLKDLFNVKIITIGKQLKAVFAGNTIEARMPKIQWVSKQGVKGELLVPDLLEKVKNEINEDSLYTISGLFEPAVKSISWDDIVQLERVGFARLQFDGIRVSGHIVHQS